MSNKKNTYQILSNKGSD